MNLEKRLPRLAALILLLLLAAPFVGAQESPHAAKMAALETYVAEHMEATGLPGLSGRDPLEFSLAGRPCLPIPT